MTNEEIAVRLTDHDKEIGSLKYRMKAAEEDTRALNRPATAVEVMATKQDVISDSVDRLTGKVEALEAEPGKQWKFVMEKSIYCIVAALMGFALARFGL